MNTPYERLEDEIKKSHLTMKQVAILAGIPYSTFHSNYCGKSSFSYDNALKIKGALKTNIPVVKLFERTQDSTPEA